MNQTIAVSKAVAIILMVVGHAGCPEVLNRFIYSFHMPLFFFASGYLFKDKDLVEPLKFTKHKIERLYVPFVKWSLIFLLFHNILYKLGFYATEYSLTEYFKNAIRYITMMGSEQLLGGFWFLKELLIVSIICFSFIKLSKKTKNGIYIVTSALLLTSWIVGILPFKIPFISGRTFLSSFVFMVGYIVKRENYDKYLFTWPCTVISITTPLILVIVAPHLVGNIDTAIGLKLFSYTIISILGCFGIYSTSNLIVDNFKKLSNALVFVGTQTLYILIFHFFAFKFVSIFAIDIIGVNGDSWDFPTIKDIGGYWWIAYSIIGVLLPILFGEIVNTITEAIEKLKHKFSYTR